MDWTARALDLVILIDPERRFARGEFENMDDAAWDALVTELRGKALTEEKLAEIRAREQQKAAAKTAALAKLSKADKEALGL